jgi:antitoxin ParD1/3/4
MGTLTISLPEASSAWLDERVRSGEFASAGEYLRALIDRDREERQLAPDELGRVLDEAEASGISDRSVDQIAAAAWARHAR